MDLAGLSLDQGEGVVNKFLGDPVASLIDPGQGQGLFMVGDLFQGDLDDVAPVGAG